MPTYTPSAADQAKVADAFTYHPPVAEFGQAERYEVIRREARDFADLLLRTCPPSRELSLALTNLEQAVMWSNASIARNEKPALRRETPPGG